MWSSRLRWTLEPNPIATLLAQKRAAGEHILDLTESNPTHAGLKYPAHEITAALADARSIHYDPAPAGMAVAREAICANCYAGRVTPDRLLLTSSTSEAYGFLFKLLTDPGDEVLVPAPSYPLFDFLAGMELVQVKRYRLAYDGRWDIDLDELERQITSHTRAVVVVNPNNPTGSFLKRREAERLDRICASRGIAIISDEVFFDYPLRTDPERAPLFADPAEALTFHLSGLSKIAGLPQMKLGWIAVDGPEALRRAAMERLELIADTYLSVGAPVQYAAERLLEIGIAIRAQITERTLFNLRHSRATIADSPIRALDVEGGWYVTLEVPRLWSEEEWTLKLLREYGVLVQPGFFYDFEREAFLVLSLLTPSGDFAEGLRRILTICGTI
jgi:alanine-synthesizing transaminase